MLPETDGDRFLKCHRVTEAHRSSRHHLPQPKENPEVLPADTIVRRLAHIWSHRNFRQSSHFKPQLKKFPSTCPSFHRKSTQGPAHIQGSTPPPLLAQMSLPAGNSGGFRTQEELREGGRTSRAVPPSPADKNVHSREPPSASPDSRDRLLTSWVTLWPLWCPED